MASFGPRRRTGWPARFADGGDEGNVDGVRAKLYAAREPHSGKSPVPVERGVGRYARAGWDARSTPALERSGTRTIGR
jgi:hypothetical protein